MKLLNPSILQNLLLLSSKNQTPLLILLQNMVDDCSTNISVLQQAFAINDINTANQLLHKIRGSFSTIGAELFAKKCAEIEQQLHLKHSPNQDEQLQIYTLYQDSCTALQQFLKQQTTDKNAPTIQVDLQNLLDFLDQKNMAATQLASAGSAQIKQLLPSKEVAIFFHHIALLNYTAAANLLRPHVIAKQHKQRIGD